MKAGMTSQIHDLKFPSLLPHFLPPSHGRCCVLWLCPSISAADVLLALTKESGRVGAS